MMNSRKALVKLACLAHDDKKWILDALSISERRIVERQLSEIEALGLNKDPSVVFLFDKEKMQEDEKPILVSELMGVADIENLEKAWQVVLIGCMEEGVRERFSKKHNIIIGEKEKVDRIPPEFRKSLLSNLKLLK